ncbi:MAG: sigma-70 family RNA polymerase sigma factor [Phycisphaerae bacterium]
MVPPQDSTAAPAAEADLLDKLRAGDDDAYEAMIRSEGGRMLAVARRLLRNEEDARDAVQEAFLGAFRNLDKFEGQSKLSTWLHRIVVNAALMKLRSKSRKPENSIEDLLPKFSADGHVDGGVKPWRDDVASALERKETRQTIHELIGQLPEGYRTVLMLRDIEELDTKETATVMEISENAVKTRLHRARLALRTLLDERFREDAA